jgi:nucleoside-diphosphate-sugar epimerase
VPAPETGCINNAMELSMQRAFPSSRPSVLILGANGRLGCAAAQAFDAAGWQVYAQVRRDASPEVPAGAVLVRAPLSNPAQVAALAANASVVVHAVNPIYTRWDEEALPALGAGLQIADQLGAHFMLPGNVYNFGESMPGLLGEQTPQRPSTRKGELRVEMEALMAQRASRGRCTASVVRAGDFFGAGTGTYLDLVVVKSLSTGKLVYPGPLGVKHAWAYLPDLAQAFVRVASIERPAPFAVWHFEGHTLTGHEFLDATEAALKDLGLDRAFKRGELPWRLIRAGGLVLPMWRELARMSYLWRVAHALDGSRLAALGGLSHTPLQQALRASLRLIALPGTGAPAVAAL